MACIDSSVVRYCNSLIVDWLSQIHGCEHIQFLHLLGIDGDKQWRAVVFLMRRVNSLFVWMPRGQLLDLDVPYSCVSILIS